VITLDLAKRLRAAGIPWAPAPGDRFIVPDRDMDRDVFVISDIVVEVHELPTGRMLGFNGTTEWALDSIEQQEVLWLPREDQLRDMLGSRFLRLESAVAGFVVVIDHGGFEQRHADGDAERAYARAVLAATDTDD
jgi:hypothetical protein